MPMPQKPPVAPAAPTPVAQPMHYVLDIGITINIPALDALIALLSGTDQAKIDNITAAVTANRDKVQAVVDSLKT